ncbi:MAG TPA: T9SS type A sorting domain-containing protein [Bacteroidia bacterium]|nr:T9SS type A sorting domain-containing protein [Bacteroidia bacterium]
MRKLLALSFFTFSFSFFTLLSAQTGTWSMVASPAPHPNMGVCLLMTDGTVICHNTSGGGEGTGWDRLTPDIHGSYANGTWDTIANMNNDRLFFSSQVLPSGKVYAAGGEYGAGGVAGEIYDPKTNIWTLCGAIPSGWSLYDANSEILYDGTVLEGPQIADSGTQNCLILSPVTNNYTLAATALYGHDEAQWLKLKDSTIVTVGINTFNANRYFPKNNTWVNENTLPVFIWDGLEEAGPGLMLPNGNAIFFGATPANVIYTPSGNSGPGTWTVADSFPSIGGVPMGMSDAPAAMMVNGKILCSIAPYTNAFAPPAYFVEYDYTTNTFTQVTAPIPITGGDSIPVASYQTQMLDLPDGTVLVSVSQSSSYSNSYMIYTPGSGPIPQGKPTINTVVPQTCNNYLITGKLFNGISEGAAYGDDWQMETNYPIVRLTDGTNVYYATTTDWNRIGAIQTDSLEDSAHFSLPSIPGGTYSLVVVANGFASNPILFTTFGVSATATTGCSSIGSATAVAADGPQPYTYSWSPSGGTNATASGLSAGTYTVTVTGNGGCSTSASVTITFPSPLSITVDSVSGLPCNGGNSGFAIATVSGGKAQYTYSWSGSGETNSTATGLSAGTYTVTVSDSCGNTATATASITQPSAPLVLTTYAKNIVTGEGCDGIAAVTASGGTAPYTYAWTPGGQTTDTIKNQCVGNYCCTITDNNGCSQTTCIDLVSGIDNIQSGNGQILIYPNPSNGIFTIQLANGNMSKDHNDIQVFNELGQQIYPPYKMGAEFTVDLSSQSAGIYFLRVISNKGYLLGEGKLVIQK